MLSDGVRGSVNRMLLLPPPVADMEEEYRGEHFRFLFDIISLRSRMRFIESNWHPS